MSAKAVVFDLDGVYFEGGTERFIAALTEAYGLSEDEVKDVYLRSAEMKEYKAGRMSGQEFWSYAIKTWGIDATPEDVLGILGESYTENPETLKLIEQLRTKGVKTAVCTNNFPERISTLDKRFRFKRHFDVFVTSYEEGVLKPNPEIFLILAKKLHLPPAEIIMSDDHQSVIDTLQQLGFQAFLYTGLADFKKRVGA